MVIPPGMTRGRPPGRPSSRPTNAPASAEDQPQSPGLSSAAIVRLRRRRHRYPIASASLYEPAFERTWWWISLRCPWCGAVHLHRVRQEQDAEGVRRTGCGRRVYVKVRTVYRGKSSLRTVA